MNWFVTAKVLVKLVETSTATIIEVSNPNRKSSMLPFQIKICGVKRIEDAQAVSESGADAIGFNFYPPSPRFVELENATALCRFIAESNQQLKIKVQKVGVFVNASVSEMVETARACRLDGIQLHGDETATIVAELKSSLAKLSRACFVARAIRANPNTANLNKDGIAIEIDAWTQAGADMLLLDAAVPGEFGGTGHVLDWHSVADLETNIPLTLAGGLTPENVGEAISISKVQSVDVASGVEAGPGIKSREKILKFVSEAKARLS